MPRGEIVRYDESWFLAIIQEAAQRAGIKDVWFAEHIARGIVIYLRERFSQTSIGIEELFAKISQTLQVVGFPQIARQLEPSAPPVLMCLDSLAAQAGSGYELSFFQLLSSALRDARERGSVHVHCAGLQSAVNRLCRAKRWSRRCEHLRDEILAFVSSEVCAGDNIGRFSAIVS
jgi:hypothetical protein